MKPYLLFPILLLCLLHTQIQAQSLQQTHLVDNQPALQTSQLAIQPSSQTTQADLSASQPADLLCFDADRQLSQSHAEAMALALTDDKSVNANRDINIANAGFFISRAAVLRNAAIVTPICTTLMGSLLLASEASVPLGSFILMAGGVAALVLEIYANNSLKRAGLELSGYGLSFRIQ